MRRLAITLSLICVYVLGLYGQTHRDSSDILNAIQHWETGWNSGNVALTTRDYARDAHWTNAFGDRISGRDSLKSFLRLFLSFGFVRAGQTEYTFNQLTFLNPDIALLHSRSVVSGQLYSNEQPMDNRRLNHLRVFEKRRERWVIVSHLISQEIDKK